MTTPKRDEDEEKLTTEELIAKINTREASTLVFSTVAASASLLIFALVFQKNDSEMIPEWLNLIGFLFSLLGLLYREVTIFTIDLIDYKRLNKKLKNRLYRYPCWAVFPRKEIILLFIMFPIGAWTMLLYPICTLVIFASIFIISVWLSALEWLVTRL